MHINWVMAVLLAILPSGFVAADSEWLQFRGSNGQGISTTLGVPLEWDEETNVVWKTPIVGEGWSSPVYSGRVAWVTSATEIAASEEQRLEKVAGSPVANALELASKISLWVTKIDLDNGRVLQEIKLAEVDDPQCIHSLNSYASPTPALRDDRLYCHFGDFGTFCLDCSTGETVWQRRIQLDHSVGPGSSPLLYEDLLVLTCDGMQQQYVTALDAGSGETVWRTDRPPIAAENPEFRKAFSTPLAIDVGDATQLIVPGAQWFVAYEPRTGKELWRVDHGRGFSNVPRPVYDGRFVYMCTGYATSQLWAIAPDGQGDVTDSHVHWRVTKQIPNMPSPVVFGQRIYTVSDGGIAQCFETSSGDRLWKDRVGGKFSASPLLAGRHLYLCSHDGTTTVISAGDTYREVARNQLDGQLMASPVVVGDDLLLRTGTHLYRIGD
ncbi:MAG: PQQ-binding-like beta-propeller repeat protein [Planctomycetota bacterium]